MIDFDDGLTLATCNCCEEDTAKANLSSCMICETFPDACGECFKGHVHTAEEIEAARRDLLQELSG